MSETYPFPTPAADPSLGETMEQKRSALYQMSHACEDWNVKYTECTDKYYAVKVSSRMTTSRMYFFLRTFNFALLNVLTIPEQTSRLFYIWLFSNLYYAVSHFDLCKDVFKDYKTCLDDHMAGWVAYRRFADKK